VESSISTFCVKPWIHLLIHPDGNISPCCNLYEGPSKGKIFSNNNTPLNITINSIEELMHSNTLKEIRSYLLQGKQHPECQVCWNSEKAKIGSNRIPVYKSGNKTFSYQEARKITDINSGEIIADFHLIDFDLRLGNLCNLKCRPCDPTKSNLLHKDWTTLKEIDCFNDYFKNIGANSKKKYSWVNLDNNLEKIINHTKNATSISMAGGEPFLIKAYEAILQNLINSKRSSEINLRYETNMTLLPQTVIQQWPTFQKITLSISLDGIFKINDYIRYPSKFEIIEQNISNLQKMKLPNLIMVIEITVSIFNIYYLPEILKYHQTKWSNRTTISFHLLFSPLPYSITVLPISIKKTISKKLKTFIETCDNSTNIKSDLLGIENHMMQTHRQGNIFQTFLEITAHLDTIRKQNIFDYLPEFASLIYDYMENTL